MPATSAPLLRARGLGRGRGGGCAIWAAGFTAAGVIAGTAWATLSATLGRILFAIAGLTLVTLLVRRS